MLGRVETHELNRSQFLKKICSWVGSCQNVGMPVETWWGGTDLERGYGDVRPWRPPFHASPVVHKGPISSKTVSSQDPFWENLEILASNALISVQILAPKPPYLKIFSSQASSFRGKYQFASLTLRKSGLHTPTWKKVECPPRDMMLCPFSKRDKVHMNLPHKLQIYQQYWFHFRINMVYLWGISFLDWSGFFPFPPKPWTLYFDLVLIL